MLSALILLGFKITTTIAGGYFLWIALRNYRDQKNFIIKSKGLPILPNGSLFLGHVLEMTAPPNNIQFEADQHFKYGPTYGWFACNQPYVSTTDLDLLKLIIFDEANDHTDRDYPGIFLKEFRYDSLLFASGEQWRRLRKVTAPAFSNLKIRMPEVQSQMQEVGASFINSIKRRLENAPNKWIEIETDDLFHRYSLDISIRTFHDIKGMVDFDSPKEWIQEAHKEPLERFVNPLYKLALMFPIYMPFYEWKLTKFYTIGKFRRLLKKAIMDPERYPVEENKNYPDDIKRMKFMINQYHSGVLSKSELIHNHFYTFEASHKTTSDALARLFYLLAQNPHVQDKLRKSILEEGEKSKYMDWCIHETLRLYPPVPGGVARVISRDIQTKEGFLPKGTCICSSVYRIHRLPQYWGEHVEEFKPERWVDSSKFHSCQFLAFGLGKRNCLGNKFALQSMKLLIVSILPQFHFSESPSCKGYLSYSSVFGLMNIPVRTPIIRVEQLEP